MCHTLKHGAAVWIKQKYIHNKHNYDVSNGGPTIQKNKKVCLYHSGVNGQLAHVYDLKKLNILALVFCLKKSNLGYTSCFYYN